MKLEELFLGRERLVPVKGGKKLKVRQLPGTDIFIAPDGSFVMPRWSGVEEGKTPLQRHRKKWRPNELRYVVYSQGLPAALRSRQLALLQARVVSCPTYQTALTVFLEEARSAIISKEGADSQSFSPALRQKLQTFGFVFQRAQKTGVKEAMVKILFLYQDDKGGLNVGAMLARTVAITDRLRERLLGLYAWVRKYSAQRNALLAIEGEINEIIFRAASELEALGRDPKIIQGQGNRAVQKLIIDKLTTMSIKLEQVKLVQPFSRWMSFVIKDFDELLAALGQQDFVLARVLIERILFSIRLKSLQRSLGRILLRLGQDAIIKKLDWNNYAVWTTGLVVHLEYLVKQETMVGLREKVCRVAALALELAVEETETLRRFKVFKALIKRAYAIL